MAGDGYSGKLLPQTAEKMECKVVVEISTIFFAELYAVNVGVTNNNN